MNYILIPLIALGYLIYDYFMTMRISTEAKNLIKKKERFSAVPYPDAHGYSIGYGHFLGTDKSKYVGLNWSEQKASEEFDKRIKKDEAYVRSLIVPTAQISQGFFDCLVDLAYNSGHGFGDNLIRVIQNPYARVSEQKNILMQYVNSQGRFNPVLYSRRKEFIDKFLV